MNTGIYSIQSFRHTVIDSQLWCKKKELYMIDFGLILFVTYDFAVLILALRVIGTLVLGIKVDVQLERKTIQGMVWWYKGMVWKSVHKS